MIHWLTQTKAELPAPTQSMARYLNEEEHARLSTLKTIKRRDDWLLGRWTAKRLLQTIIWEKGGLTLPLDMIAITNKANGVPDYQVPVTDHRYSISISHSHGRAFVAAVENPDAALGVDLELIQPRPPGFAEDYFTLAEIVLGFGLLGQERAVWETAVWSAKEATLKALHLGLSVDTRTVSCLIEPVNLQSQTWLPYAIQWDDGRLPNSFPHLTGWWQVKDNYVLTIAVGEISKNRGSYLS